MHVTNLEDLTRKDAETVFKTLYQLVNILQKAVGAPASTIVINNGPESGQEIPHLHVHIIPRFTNNDGRSKQLKGSSLPNIEEMKQIAENIRIQDLVD